MISVQRMALVAVSTLGGMLDPSAHAQVLHNGKLWVVDDDTFEYLQAVVASELGQRLLSRLRNAPLQGAGSSELNVLQRALERVKASGVWNPLVGFDWLFVQDATKGTYLKPWKQGHGMPGEVKEILLLNGIPIPRGKALLQMSRRDSALERSDFDQIAEELLSGTATPDQLLLGHLYELHEGDEEARVRAALFLGQVQELAEIIVPHLLAELADAPRRVVQEIITALGMIGPAAKAALPDLDKLAGHDDPQIAERAKAALRQIGKGGG